MPRDCAAGHGVEQVLGVAPRCRSCSRAVPNLLLLATSRALLRIAGERDYSLESLQEADAVGLLWVPPEFVSTDRGSMRTYRQNYATAEGIERRNGDLFLRSVPIEQDARRSA